MTDPEPQRIPIWQWPHLANLMAPAVACAWLAGLAAVYRLYVPGTYFVLLAAATWTVYTLDGLLDSRQPAAGQPGRSATRRALFHRRFRVPFLVLLVLVIGSTLFLALSAASASLVMVAGGLGLLVAVYLAHAQALRSASWTLVPKEVFAGAIFAAGVMLPVLDLQGRFPFADPAAMAMAAKGVSTFLLWLGWLVIATLGSLAMEPTSLLLAILFSTNCLLTAASEPSSEEAADPASARRVARPTVRMAPWVAFGLTAGAMLVPAGVSLASWRTLSLLVGLSSFLMLGTHLLHRKGWISPAAACFWLDCALLVPLGLLPSAMAG